MMFIEFSKIDFQCPYCSHQYYDDNDFFYKRINKNKCGYTKWHCSCENKFGISIDMTGQIVGFKLK